MSKIVFFQHFKREFFSKKSLLQWNRDLSGGWGFSREVFKEIKENGHILGLFFAVLRKFLNPMERLLLVIIFAFVCLNPIPSSVSPKIHGGFEPPSGYGLGLESTLHFITIHSIFVCEQAIISKKKVSNTLSLYGLVGRDFDYHACGHEFRVPTEGRCF